MFNYLKQKFNQLMMCFEPTLLDWLSTLEQHDTENCVHMLKVYNIDEAKRYCNMTDALVSLKGNSTIFDNYINFLIEKYCHEL